MEPPETDNKQIKRQTDVVLSADVGSWHSTCLDFGFGTRGFITGDFSSFVALLSAAYFLYDLFILSKILAERPEFTAMVGSLELVDT